MEHIKTLLTASLILLALALLVAWTVKHDQLVAQASQDYEKCMHERTGMSPANFYQLHGYYPECF
jgi:hypothetical protein